MTTTTEARPTAMERAGLVAEEPVLPGLPPPPKYNANGDEWGTKYVRLEWHVGMLMKVGPDAIAEVESDPYYQGDPDPDAMARYYAEQAADPTRDGDWEDPDVYSVTGPGGVAL
jgi:hypothetical protein